MRYNKKVMNQTIVSGLKPSGDLLHIGNYLGMLKQAVALQESHKGYSRLYFIADYHSLTQTYNHKEKAQEIFSMAVDALAAGLDPKASTIFVQSHVPEHANLAWILGTIASTGRLGNMIEYKEKIQEGHTPNVGLFTYPVLMAADILLYNASFVPVGEDQRQHLELTRDIAKTFNERFGKTFRVPQILLTKTPRVMSLDNPYKKMSKSLPAGCLYLADSPRIIREKLKASVTDSFREIAYEPEARPGVSNLVVIHSEFSGKPIEEVVEKFRGVGYAEFKDEVASVLITALKPIQLRREELLKDKKKALKILEDGAKRAHAIAAETMGKVRKRVGLL